MVIEKDLLLSSLSYTIVQLLDQRELQPTIVGCIPINRDCHTMVQEWPIFMIRQEQPNTEIIQIICECQAGSHTAFKELVARYDRAAYGIAYHMLHNAELSKDISQEAFIRVFYAIKRFDIKRSFYTWLYQIVVNLCIDYLRSHKTYTQIDDLPIADSKTPGPDERVIKEEEQRIIRETMDTLPANYKAVLILRDIEGLPSKEVAQALNCSDGAVRWTLCEARKRFKEAWLKSQKSQEGVTI
jgi:RNA polymerase sigma-70 factor, ECF subfamily